MEEPVLPQNCPYCGKKLEHWLGWDYKLTECKKCKVKWVISIKPECLKIEELPLK